uniref:Malate dehydrogenase, mitochondrial n=1 Tax=Meloidogyne enterolobii TaxID=390850 RepID=A0A6V7VQJ4_MELEN|nr:unnamed protein product [Meloidogyne enterolobii]
MSTNKQQFQCTNKMNNMLMNFRDSIVLKKHTRNLKAYLNTFTGQSGVDCIMKIIPKYFDHEKCNTTTARNTFTYFLKSRLVINAEDEDDNQKFGESKIYRLNMHKINEKLANFEDFEGKKTQKIRRSSSLKSLVLNYGRRRSASSEKYSSSSKDRQTKCKEKSSCASDQSLRNSISAVKVTLVGASGGIGQHLALFLKENASVAHLALYDIVGTPEVCADLSFINTPVKVTAHMGPNELSAALKDADIVVVTAAVPRKPGMTNDDLFNTNAAIVRDVAEAAAKACPDAFLSIITNPVNSNLPIASEVL